MSSLVTSSRLPIRRKPRAMEEWYGDLKRSNARSESGRSKNGLQLTVGRTPISLDASPDFVGAVPTCGATKVGRLRTLTADPLRTGYLMLQPRIVPPGIMAR